ncbi:MAG: ATP-grasp domain-containing protein [Ruminococcaceae bacterium]|nr:ATP-grasp domain-containing protein [Oscillospiraceae bacterium]
MKQINILVFPCGSEIGLELHRSLKDIRFITLFGASSVSDHGEWVYKNYVGNIPFISDPSFVDVLNKYIDDNKIDYIFPALDSVIVALSQNREKLHAEILTCPHETVEICRSKKETYAALSGCEFLPKTYADINEIQKYPVIIKPSKGQGSQGFMIIESKEQLEYELSARRDEQVICEYLPGEEYTIDCFTDRHGSLLYACQRNRGRIKNGISVSSTISEPDEKILEIANEINSKMRFRGVWFFQLKRNADGEYRLLECATRVAGTMCVQRAAGVNLALLTVFDALGYDIDIPERIKDVTVDRALYNTFKLGIEYDEVYMDFDDTVIIHDRVNFTVLQFIYQCVENKIPVTLLTRHETDIIVDLKARRISPELFDNIVCLPRSERKIDHVKPSKKALFVDDSFQERKSMHDAFGIYTLGPDSVEALLNERK